MIHKVEHVLKDATKIGWGHVVIDVIQHILGLTAPRDAALTVPLVVPEIPESVIVV